MTINHEPPKSPAGPADLRSDHRMHHRFSMQNLVLAWCIYLIGNWLITLLNTTPQLAAQRLMPFAALFGLTILWPAYRLSLWRVHNGVRHGEILREWLALNLVLQSVIWPLMLNASWTATQAFYLAGVLAGWSLLMGLIVAWGVESNSSWRRTGAMAACLVLVLGEPAILGLLNAGATGTGGGIVWPMRASPLPVVAGLIVPHDEGGSHQYVPHMIAVTAAAALGWVGLSLLRHRATPSPPRTGAGENQ